jgi:hypothetical protein
MARKKKQPYRPPVISPEGYGIDVSRGGVKVTVGGAKPAESTAATSGLNLYGANIVGGAVNTSTLGTGQNPVTPEGKTLPQPTAPRSANQFLTPEEQQQVRDVQNVAKTVEASEPPEKSWIANLFDTSDTFDENGNFKSDDLAVVGGEAAFDGFLRGLQWGFDRVNQYTVAAMSAAPGGTRTLTFDEANDVSFGQMLVANAGISMGRVRRGESTVGDAIAVAFGALPTIGAAIAAEIDPDTPVQRSDFDITDPKDREVFNNGAERIFSGMGDFGFAFADPTLVAGWGAKIARLRYVDQLIDSPAKLQRATDEIYEGQRILQNNLDARYGTDAVVDGRRRSIEVDLDDLNDLDISPRAMFLRNAVRQDADGKKLSSWEEIYNHKVIRFAGNRDALATALYNARTYDEAALVMRQAMGDKDAVAELMTKRPDIFTELIDGERALISNIVLSDPKKKAKMIAEHQARLDRYDRELKVLYNNADDPDFLAKVNDVLSRKNTEIQKWLDVVDDNGSRVFDPAELELAQKRIDFLRERNSQLDKTIRQAQNATGSLVEITKGFSANNRFGRFVEGSRQRRARAQYETETTRGSKLWESTEFAYLNNPLGKVRRTLRVWRYLGAEAPSGIIRIAGVGAQESAREVRAMLNSMRFFGGKGRTIVDADGVPRTVGGTQRKEELLTEYVNSVTRGGVKGQADTARVLRELEAAITEEMKLFYGIQNNSLDGLLNATNLSRKQIKESILKHGFWVDKVKGKNIENKAPYLESQLQGAEIAYNWRAIENAVLRDKKTTRQMFDPAIGWSAEAYNNFQDIWRPAVLLRLGYTQRNVAEGLFRSAAFQFSLAPFGLAARQLGMSTGNTIRSARYGREGGRGAVQAATVAAREGATIENMPRAFRKWHAKNVESIDATISHHVLVMDEAVRELARENKTWRLAKQQSLRVRLRKLAKEKERLRNNRPAGMTENQADAAVARLDLFSNDIERRLALMDGIDGGAVGALPDDLASVASNLDYFDELIMPMLFAQREMLTDMRSSALMFREQTLAKRRVFQGQANVTDPETLRSTFMAYSNRGAFDPNDTYANIALANLSSDATNRQVMALRVNTMKSLMSHQITKVYVARNPGEEGYWDGLATMFNQWKQSDVGAIIIREIAQGQRTDDEIAALVGTFLRDTPRGREIAHWVTNGDEVKGEYLVEYGQRVAQAHEAALKAALPEREAADTARDAIRQAEDDVAWARRKLAEDQRTKPSRTTLVGPDGKQIRDPEKYVQRRRDAYTKAERKYQDKVERLDKPKDLPDGVLAPALSIEDAIAYSTRMIQRYRQLTANSPELQRMLFVKSSLSTNDQQPFAKFASELETIIGPNARNANGDKYNLIPVIGNDGEIVGSKSFMDTIRAVSDKGFRILGTIPEDTFVRAPFYGRRFQQTYDTLTRLYLAQKPDNASLSVSEVNAIRQASHSRALKDTKDWLYTIDRRTLLGQYGEAVFPFISASQNSLTAVGRILWNDPRVAALMVMIWNAPSRAGLEDEEGRIHFSAPLEWIPEGLRDKLGLSSMLDFTFNKQQFNLIAPPTGFGGALPIPTPGPVVVLPVSELMKHDILGMSPTAPDPLVSVLGQDTADQVWDFTKSYIFGSDEDISGMSAAPFSIDKVLPAWGQKVFQFLQGEGSSSAYTAWYDKIYQSEQLKYWSGYRDEPPTPNEISDKTRNFYFMRMAFNLAAFTPPGFTSEITPVMDAARRIYESEPNTDIANMKIYEKFGGTVQQILRIRSTESVAGLDATADSIRLAKNHSDLIGAVAPRLSNNNTLNLIGVLAGNTRGDYDPSFSAAQQLANIPNTDRFFREVKNPAQAAIDTQISAGWAQYLRNMDVINAKLAERGLKSLRSAGAEDLMKLKKEMVARLRVDPRYEAWYGDYMSGVSSRTLDTVMVIQTALSDQRWRDAHKDDPIWGLNGAADQYMYARDQVLEALASTDDSEVKKQIKEQWINFRFDLGMRFPDWGTKQERYLSGDEDPDQPQIVLTSDIIPFTPAQADMSNQMPNYYPEGMG